MPAAVTGPNIPRFEGKAPEVTAGGGNPIAGFGGAITALKGGKDEDAGRTGAAQTIPQADARAIIFPELGEGAAKLDLTTERRLAGDAEKLGRWDEASRRWRRIAEAEPQDLGARLSFARALSRTGQTRRAGEEFENLTRAYPSNDQAWFEYGNFLSLVSEPEKARDAYETALRLNPDSAEVRNNLGALHVREREYGNARVVLTDLNDRFPGYGPGWLNRAILEDEGSKDFPAALNALETYLRLGGRQTDVIERWQARLRAQTGGASYEGVPGG